MRFLIRGRKYKGKRKFMCLCNENTLVQSIKDRIKQAKVLEIVEYKEGEENK